MSRLEQKLFELGYELIKLQDKKFICLKCYDDEIEIVITLDNGIIIEDLCEVRIQGSYSFNKFSSLNEFHKDLTLALIRLRKDLEVLRNVENS